MSRCLSERSIDHVVLERGEVAHTWRTERWDSLRLLTPNWQSRLPGFNYNGDDPDGYRTLAEVIEFIASYAKAISAPPARSKQSSGPPATDPTTIGLKCLFSTERAGSGMTEEWFHRRGCI
jgi:hypothetical protein